MHLRSGRIMSNSEHQSTSEPRPSLEQTINDLAKNVRNLMDRVEQIEASQRETSNHEGDNMLRQNHHGYFNRAPNFEHQSTSEPRSSLEQTIEDLAKNCP